MDVSLYQSIGNVTECQRATREVEKVVMSAIELSTELNVQLRAEFVERLKKDEQESKLHLKLNVF